MKKQTLILTFLCIQSVVFGQLSIQEAQHKARENYPLIKQYELVEKSKEYDLANASRSYLPQLVLSGKASYQSDVTQIPISFPGIDIPTLSKDQYQVVVELNQKIWDGGETSAQRNITKYAAEVDKQKIEVDLYGLRERVNQVFFGIILLDEQLKLNNLLKDEYQNSFNRIKALVDNGLANQSDIDAIQVEQLKSEQRDAEITISIEAYKQMLSLLIGESPLPQLIKPEIPLLDFNYSNNRAELQLFDAQNSLYDNMRKSINSASIPRLGLFAQGGYGKPGLNMLKDEFSPFFIGGIRLSWNISGLYTHNNRLKQLEVDKKRVEAQRDEFLFNYNLLSTQQQNEVKKMQKVITSDDKIISLRNNIKESAKIKMDNGTISATDLIREINAENLAIQEKILHEIQLLINIENLKTTTNN